MLNDQHTLVVPDGTNVICNGRYREKDIERVFIPRSVREIKKNAFCNCKDLREVIFEEGSTLKTIGQEAFRGCINLTRAVLPEGLEKIDLYAFSESGLENVTFPPSLRTVSQGAFSKCKNLRETRLNEGLEVLGTSDCKQNGEMHDGVFQECALESVEFPSTLKRIEYNAFYKCSNLKNIVLPERLEYIGN